MQFNIAEVNEAIAAAVPDREAIIWRDKRITYGELNERSRRLANALVARGMGVETERDHLQGHESGQDHLALYLYNGNEYLEGMLGAFMARVAPLNVNYRYVAEELEYLLTNSQAKAIAYHAEFAPTLAEVLPKVPHLGLLIQVADDSGNELLPGAVDYEELLASSSPEKPAVADQWSPDDLYILYTGGTTGLPKGVLWRQSDIFVGAMGGRPFGQPDPLPSVDAFVEVAKNGGTRMMVNPPLMHGAAQWAAFSSFTGGNTIVMPSNVKRFDAPEVLSLAERERTVTIQVVGDAFGRPLVDEMETGKYDLSGLFAVVNGGAPLNAAIKERILDVLPNGMVLDAVGSSEAGIQMAMPATKGAATTGDFTPHVGSVVVSEDLTRLLDPGEDATGWLAQTGYVPLGYLGDAEKTARTFPVIDGTRYSVPGDRARIRADGVVDLLGRDSVTINSGGEKIFAEEVEMAIAQHPAVYDVVVVGRPSERWGSEVVALVQLAEGQEATDDELLEEAAEHVARYKLPKQIVRFPALVRSPAGKADYRWAKAQAEAAEATSS